MKLNIEQIKVIIKAAEKLTKVNGTKEIADLTNLFLDKVFEQTKIKNLNDLKKIINFYDSYKTADWFKKGIEEVLLNGNFPCVETIREVIKEVPTIWPKQLNNWPETNPIVQPPYTIWCKTSDNMPNPYIISCKTDDNILEENINIIEAFIK
ncbi:MAG: hypothetical protein NC222_06655 [Staphylococcus sp.]|nr:hypothetical protein [Staphylococcus sp.]